MILAGIGSRRKQLICISLLACAAFTMVVFFYNDSYFLSGGFPKSFNLDGYSKKSRERTVLLPAGFKFPKSVLKEHLAGTSAVAWDTLQLKNSEIVDIPPHEPGLFTNTDTYIYSASSDSECGSREQKATLARDGSEKMSMNLNKTLEIFREEAEKYGDTYNQHLFPVLGPFMREDKFETAWYRLSGSSVWLKDYNVHLVVSRLEVSELELRDHPRLSMPFAQVFDEEWNEIEDVRIVFPTNSVEDSPGFTVGDQDFLSYRFPRFLPIPYDIGQVHKYWGAEDPRMTLVKNPNGHEEPVVVFNAFHVKSDIDKSEPDVPGTRSIFMSFPFQLQKGKQIEAADTEVTLNNWFSRTKKLAIEGEPEKKIEKNWVPFVSSKGDYHEHVMFATSLEPLKIIKCDLWTDNSVCVAEESKDDNSISALRGGTALVSVKRIDEQDKEFFIGFARANLRGCGCGFKFYRPNLIMIARTGKQWTLTHVSSFIDLGMEIIPWKPEENVCDRINAMIPNGIEFVDLERDVMSVDVSVSDITVERVHLHGVLIALEDAKYWEAPEGHDLASPVGCALEASKDFCKAYGLTKKPPSKLRSIFE